MAVLEIRRFPDPVLRRKAIPVERPTKKLNRLIKDMLETMYSADGIGLAAPQVGILQRIIVVDIGRGPLVLLNPEILESRGQETDVEGCLSLPGVTRYVTRPAEILVQGYDERNRGVRFQADGLLARAIQHEIDHLEGILLVDRATDFSPQRKGEPEPV